MIEQAFFLACDAEIAQLDVRIVKQQAALNIEESREMAELLRVRIKALEKLVETVKSSRNTILIASLAVKETEGKFIRWRAVCAEARAAHDEMAQLARELETAQAACIPAQNAIALAEAELLNQQRIPLPQFATQPEKARAKAAEDKLRKQYEGAVAKLRELAGVRDEINRGWVTAAKKYDELCFRERMSRLPSGEPAQPSYAATQIRGVDAAGITRVG
jgi:predicted ATPase